MVSAAMIESEPVGKSKEKPNVISGNTSQEPLTVKEAKLLARVTSFYQHTFTQDTQRVHSLMNDWGITDQKSFEDFGAGFADGGLLEILPDDDEIVKRLKRIGILNSTGKEALANHVVFPLYDSTGSGINLCGVMPENGSQAEPVYLSDPSTGMVNRQAVKRCETIIFTGSIIDALILYDQGFRNVIPTCWEPGLSEERLSLITQKIRVTYLLFNSEQMGKTADPISLQLKRKGIDVHLVNLPEKDLISYFNRHRPEEFAQLLKQTNPSSKEQSEEVCKRQQSLYRETEHGFLVGYGDRQYEIKGVQRGDTQLKVTIKASLDLQSRLPFELTTLDLYSSRSRTWFSKLCSSLFGVTEEIIKADMEEILTLVENFKLKENKIPRTEMPPADKEAALQFLNNPNMFAEILKDMETMGTTGEEYNKLVGYLAAVSRKLDEPLSVLIQSRSATGKSTLQDAILQLVPEEDYAKYTRITDQALFYKAEDSLANKILAIEEEEGMTGAAYSIRNIQSSNKITVATTGKDPETGKIRTEEYTVRGPVAVMITTTAAEVEAETASRFLFLTIDESKHMTEAIHRKQREAETLEGLIKRKKSESITNKHHAAQRLLRPLAVVNPFAEYLTYPAGSLRTRRDHKKYLGLIRAVVFLHQYQRQVKKADIEGEPLEYIEVTLEDIAKANRLAHEVLGQSLDELARPSRTLLLGIHEMVEGIAEEETLPVNEVMFTRRMIREYMCWSDWQVKVHVKQLEELEYLLVRHGAKGRRYSYALNGNSEAGRDKYYLNLTPVEEIERLMKQEQQKNK